MKICLLLIALLCATLSRLRLCQGVDLYQSTLEEIVTLAKATARYHNAGRTHDALEAAKQCRSAFVRSVSMKENDPQPYLYFARFLHNTHKFEEAIRHFRTALDNMPAGNDEARAYVSDSIREAKLGKVSVERDRVYADGQGDIMETLTLVG